MRTFCAILLLGVVTYVKAAHKCAPYAMNVKETISIVQRQSDDGRNPAISLGDFLAEKINTFYTVKATPYVSSPNACTGPTHGSNCGGVEYTRKFVDGHDKYDENLLFKAIQLDLTFVGYNKENEYAMEYKMRIGGTDEHNYIFKLVEGTQITINKINDVRNPRRNYIPVVNSDNVISNILSKEFALFRCRPGKYYIYTTCDLETAWVTYDKDTTFSEDDAGLQGDIEMLKSLAARKGKTLELETIDRAFPKELSDYVSNVYAPSE